MAVVGGVEALHSSIVRRLVETGFGRREYSEREILAYDLAFNAKPDVYAWHDVGDLVEQDARWVCDQTPSQLIGYLRAKYPNNLYDWDALPFVRQAELLEEAREDFRVGKVAPSPLASVKELSK